MTVEGLISYLSQQRYYVVAIMLAVPVLCILLRLLHGRLRGNLSPWKYIYSVLVYLSCIPGMFSISVILYNLLFLHANLMELDIFVCYLPVLSMLVTLFIMHQIIEINQLPGFDKISGLMIISGIAFFVTLIIDRLQVFVLFYGSIFWLFIICIAIFFLLKYAMRLLFGKPMKKSRFSSYSRNFK